MDLIGTLSHYVILLGPWVVVLSSLATALTEYPKTKGVGMYIKQFLNIFSILTHSDSPKSIKSLGEQSAPPPGFVPPAAK